MVTSPGYHMPSQFECRRLRHTILEMAYAGSSVHVACAFSIVEIMAVLYRTQLHLSSGPDAPDRDYLVLSKGHGVMAQYACLKELGWLGSQEFTNYFGDGTRLKGLSDAHVPGLEVTSGSLGHGLSVGVGLALAAQRRRSGQRCFVVVGDGEMNEGTMWEALLFAQHYKLSNLIVVVDANGFQAMGRTDEVMALGDLAEKFRAFGFCTLTCEGHDESALEEALTHLSNLPGTLPRALIARTIKGHGVSWMAGDNRWHYTRLDAESFSRAMEELVDPEARNAAQNSA